jgi:hypothetical protein
VAAMLKIGINAPKTSVTQGQSLFKLTIQILPRAPHDTDFPEPLRIKVSFFPD